VLAFILSSLFLDMAYLHEEGLRKMLRFAITTYTIMEKFCQLIVHLHTV